MWIRKPNSVTRFFSSNFSNCDTDNAMWCYIVSETDSIRNRKWKTFFRTVSPLKVPLYVCLKHLAKVSKFSAINKLSKKGESFRLFFNFKKYSAPYPSKSRNGLNFFLIFTKQIVSCYTWIALRGISCAFGNGLCDTFLKVIENYVYIV